MTADEFIVRVNENALFDYTSDQVKCLKDVADYFFNCYNRQVHIVNGYAGSGKTTLMSDIVKTLLSSGFRVVLLAPTGRAAKIMSNYCNYPAFTIHKHIYRAFQDAAGELKIILGTNQLENTAFFVDEASMLPEADTGDDNYYSKRNILEDVLKFVFSKQGNRLIFIGDTAQLPPVNCLNSPALLPETFQTNYLLPASVSQLKQVVRQISDSPILSNATFIRNKLIAEDYSKPFFNTIVHGVFDNIDPYEFEEVLNTAFGNNHDESVILCRSNKQANMYNNALRARVLLYDTQLVAGEKLMVVKNNYFWLDASDKFSFIANGEMLEIQRVIKIEEVYGFHFAQASVVFYDMPDSPQIDVILMLDTLDINTASLTFDRRSLLYNNIMEDYMDIPSKAERRRAIRNNSYYNALQVKYGYALTCHKAQGGQWENVIVDKGFLKDEDINEDFFKWLYTAVTRATERIYLINFNDC
jgi:exodeoxyribonuclease V